MIKRLLAYALPTALMLPITAPQAQSTNIFESIVVGRNIVFSLNPLLLDDKSYYVQVAPSVGISAINWFIAERDYIELRASSGSVRRSSTLFSPGCKGINSALCPPSQHHMPFALSTNGGPQTSTVQLALGGMTQDEREILGQGAGEKFTLTTNPRVEVQSIDADGFTMLASARQTSDERLAVIADEPISFQGTGVAAWAPMIGQVFAWTAGPTGTFMRSCPLNMTTGLIGAFNTCQNTPVTDTYVDMAVTPNYGGVLALDTVGEAHFYVIESDARLSEEDDRVRFTGADVAAAGVDYIVAGAGTNQKLTLASSSTGAVFSCSWPMVTTSGNLTDSTCTALNVTYAGGNLVNMVHPQYQTEHVFVTAIDNKLLSCEVTDNDSVCTDIATLDVGVTAISGAMSTRERALLAAEADIIRTAEVDTFAVGLAGASVTYGSSALIASVADDGVTRSARFAAIELAAAGSTITKFFIF
ncbi:MAG: hypothetical protein P1U32_03280 [Legionellaceae bacterium]|nr:hypothetical protein [Legionellaceae bacterium]